MSKGKARGRENLACYAAALWPAFCHRIPRAFEADQAGSVAPPYGEVGQFGQFRYGRLFMPNPVRHPLRFVSKSAVGNILCRKRISKHKSTILPRINRLVSFVHKWATAAGTASHCTAYRLLFSLLSGSLTTLRESPSPSPGPSTLAHRFAMTKKTT